MRALFITLLSALPLLFAASEGHAQEAGTLWRMRVMDLKKVVKVDATIRLTAQPDRESCMGGDWKRIVIESVAARDEAFFPLAQSLSYELRGKEISVGRTHVCDGYKFLTGARSAARVKGDYHHVGLGSREKSGSFTLEKIAAP